PPTSICHTHYPHTIRFYTLSLHDALPISLGKGMSSEYANENAYDAIQIHGGSGYMKDYKCERLYRDARITNIYEGTTQLQVVARSEEHTSELQSRFDLVCRLLLEKKKYHL